MPGYEPAPELTSAILRAIVSPLPFFARTAVKIIPTSAKERVIQEALVRLIPLSFYAIASTRSPGATVSITRGGELTTEARESLFKRIALWLVPDEVTEVAGLLHKDVLRLGQEQYTEDSWKLEIRNDEVVLVVTAATYVKASADTVADVFFNSFETLKGLKDKVFGYFRPPST